MNSMHRMSNNKIQTPMSAKKVIIKKKKVLKVGTTTNIPQTIPIKKKKIIIRKPQYITKETVIIKHTPIHYIVTDFQVTYMECGDPIDISEHPDGDCIYKCQLCTPISNDITKENEIECEVKVIVIGDKYYFMNIKNGDIYERGNAPLYTHSNKQIIVGKSYSKYKNSPGIINYGFFPANRYLQRDRNIRYNVFGLKYRHPNGCCNYGCGDCNPACDDDDQMDEYEIDVYVIKIDGKDYFTNIQNGEIYDIRVIGNTGNYRYAKTQLVVGNYKDPDGSYNLFPRS